MSIASIGLSTGGWAAPLVLAAAYLWALAWIAGRIERSPRLAAAARHPTSLGLALGVFATSWTFLGSPGFAARAGYDFLAIHLGVALSCLAIGPLWSPIARVVRRHRLGSVSDLLAFRYQSQAVGAFVTLGMTAALVPYLSLQMRAIADTAQFLAHKPGPSGIGLVYAALLGLFAAGLGARYADPRHDRPGLLGALALESLVKLVALTAIGGAALFLVFGGPAGVQAHLAAHPGAVRDLFEPVRGADFPAILFSAFFAAFLLPRMFHVAFVENPAPAALHRAGWVLPALLLLLNLPLPLILWAGTVAAPGARPDTYVLAIADTTGLSWLAFLGGLSAASAMLLVTAIALGGMIVHHLLLPLLGVARHPTAQPATYARLLLIRRIVMVGVALAGFVGHIVLPRTGALIDLGLLSFSAVLQFVPAVLAALLWPRATRAGVLLGMSLGFAVWLAVAVLPLFAPSLSPTWIVRFGFAAGETFAASVWLSFVANGLGLVLGSLATTPSPEERAAAAACAERPAPPSVAPPPLPADALERRLAGVLGPDTARDEVARAREQLRLAADEARPLELRRLGEQLERNISELIGPLSARVLVGRDAPAASSEAAAAIADELRFLRERAALGRGADPRRSLELVWRYLQGVLEGLPLGVCAVDGRGVIAVWNQTLSHWTGLPAADVVGQPAQQLPDPWGRLLEGPLTRGAAAEPAEHTLPGPAGPRLFRVWGAAPAGDPDAGRVAVLEDITERRLVRAKIAHQDRLASVGRLAAGVAHEIVNPLTGILMLAKNLRAEPEAPADDRDERLGLITHEGKRIEAIVRTLLEFSRSGAAEAPPTIARFPARPWVDDAVRLVRLEERSRRLQWTLDVPDDLTLAGDRARLSQALINLLANARDASPPGGRITVSLHVLEDMSRIDVLDEGPGIPPELADRIFEPFFTTKDPGAGTGLGLALAHRIVQDHGGALTFRARDPGPGTTFSIELPAAPAEVP